MTGCSQQNDTPEPGRQSHQVSEIPFDPELHDWPHTISDLNPDPRVIYGRLDNGLRFAILPVADEKGVVAIQMNISAGYKNEPENAYGIAHMVEHMAFRGAAGRKEQTVIHDLQTMGAGFGSDLNGFTEYETTFYRLNLTEPKTKDVELALTNFSRLVTTPNLSEANLEMEKRVVIAEMKQRDTLENRANDNLIKFKYPNRKRNNVSGIGTVESVSNLTLEDARKFYETHYRPDKTLIVISGDVNAKASAKSLKRLFADWKPKPVLNPESITSDVLDFSNFPKQASFKERKANTNVAAIENLPPTLKTDSLAFRKVRFIERMTISALYTRVKDRLDTEDDVSWINIYFGRSRDEDIREIRLGAKDYSQGIKLFEEERLRMLKYGIPDEDLAFAISSARARLETSNRASDKINAWSEAKAMRIAFTRGRVYTSFEQRLERRDRFAKELTSEDYAQGAKALWQDFNPRYWTQNRRSMDDTILAMRKAQEVVAGQEIMPAATKDLGKYRKPNFSKPGKVLARENISKGRIHSLKYENGVRLNYWQNTQETNSINISVSISGIFPEFTDQYAAIAERAFVLNRAHIGGVTKSEMDWLFVEKMANFKARVRGEKLVLSSKTRPEDLDEALGVLTAFLLNPDLTTKEYDTQFTDRMKSIYKGTSASPLSTGQVKLASEYSGKADIFKSNIIRRYIKKSDIIPKLETVLKSGTLEVGIVGDFKPETLEAIFASNFGAMPPRGDNVDADADVEPREPILHLEAGATNIHYTGSDTQMALFYCWPNVEGYAPEQDTLVVLSLSIMNNRVMKTLREDMGATYGSQTVNYVNSAFPEFKYMCIASQIDSMDEAKVHTAMTQLLSDVLPVERGELKRARGPLLSSYERYVVSNQALAAVTALAYSKPEQLDFMLNADAYLKRFSLAKSNAHIASNFKIEDMHVFRVAKSKSREDSNLKRLALMAGLGGAEFQFEYAQSLNISSEDTERAQALGWFEKAAMQDFKPAHLHLGKYYAGKNENLKTAAHHLKSAQDIKEAGYLLANIYFKNPEMFPDITDAHLMDIYYQSAEAGNTYGQRALANRLKDGAITERDEFEALKWAVISISGFAPDLESSFIKRFKRGLTEREIEDAIAAAEDWTAEFWLRPTENEK